jgi:hypothetical protein
MSNKLNMMHARPIRPHRLRKVIDFSNGGKRWHTYVLSYYIATSRLTTRFVVSVPAENCISAQSHIHVYIYIKQ